MSEIRLVKLNEDNEAEILESIEVLKQSLKESGIKQLAIVWEENQGGGIRWSRHSHSHISFIGMVQAMLTVSTLDFIEENK